MEKMEDAETQMDEKYTELSMSIQDWDDQIVKLQDELVEIKSDIQKMKKQKTGKVETRDGYKRGRKTEDDSLYSQIDQILGSVGIKRAAYHGGDLTGGCIKLLMTHAEDIMKQISIVLINQKSDHCKLEPGDIQTLCNNCARLLILWDGALSSLHTDYPSEQDCVDANTYIEQAL